MSIVRANDPRANDIPHQIKLTLGQMCDMEVSMETRRKCVEKLTELMQGMPMTEATFQAMGVPAKMVKTENEVTLHVHVPKEYVSSGITENRDSQWIVFQINRALNLDNLNNSDTAVVTDLQGNPIKAEGATEQ
ncbi:MAG: hypothetical protein IKA36_06240 [Clostridia bacterium]|nr:hypothetical protein [Clostridia bacterium]